MQAAFEEVKQSNSSEQPMPNANRVFTMLMQCLAKARKILQALEGMVDNHPIETI